MQFVYRKIENAIQLSDSSSTKVENRNEIICHQIDTFTISGVFTSIILTLYQKPSCEKRAIIAWLTFKFDVSLGCLQNIFLFLFKSCIIFSRMLSSEIRYTVLEQQNIYVCIYSNATLQA